MSSIALKCVLFLVALLCVLQFAEMARVPRSPDGEEAASLPQLEQKVTDIAGQLTALIRSASDSDTMKQLLEMAQNVIAENAEKFKGVVQELQNGLSASNAGTRTDTVKDLVG